MHQEQYAKALYELEISGMGADALFTRLDAVLIKRGHQKLKKHILREYAKLHEERTMRGATLTLTKESDEETLREEILHAKKLLSLTESPKVVVEKDIIGGFVLEYNGQSVDRTYKSALLKLYRNVIK